MSHPSSTEQSLSRWFRSAHWAQPLTLLAVNLLLTGFLALSFLRTWGMPTPLTDDAFILMRFAEHIADGHGIVWNVGQRPVEGYTSFLYQMLMAGLVWFDLSPVALAPWLGTGFGVLALILTWRLSRRLSPGHLYANLLALTCVSPSFLIWATSGMETLLYTSALLSVVLSYVAYRSNRLPGWTVGLVSVLAALTRPEALVVFAVTVGFDVVDRFRRKQRPVLQPAVTMGMSFLSLYVPYFAWRWAYFGDLLPNAYYAKTGGGLAQLRGGLTYLRDSLLFTFGGAASLLALGLVFVDWLRSDGAEPLYLAAVTVVSWLTTVINGGDHFTCGRLLVPALPLVFLLMTLGVSNAFHKLTGAVWSRLVITTVLFALALVHSSGTDVYDVALAGWHNLTTGSRPDLPAADPKGMERMEEWVAGFMVMGQAIDSIAPADASIAAVPVGAIGLYSDMTVIDMVGLTHRVIAHQPFDSAYTETRRRGHDKGDGACVLSLRPDYIQLTNHLTSRPAPEPPADALQYKSVAEIWASPRFQARYEFHPLEVEGGWYYNLYRRADGDPVARTELTRTGPSSLGAVGRFGTRDRASLWLHRETPRPSNVAHKQRRVGRFVNRASRGHSK